MMLRITQKCTMECNHCLGNHTKDGKHMDFQILKDSINFLNKNNLLKSLVITGGEPTEHPDFDKFLNYIIDFVKENNITSFLTVTTNGEHIPDDIERFKSFIKRIDNNENPLRKLYFQVSSDRRYYPRRIDVTKRIYRENGFCLCDDCVEHIYPQGRALENNIKWKARASKCFNVRSISKQIPRDELTLQAICDTLLFNGGGKTCTPHIDIDGSIKLGESCLCPKCSSIYDSTEDIINSILNFKCDKCDFINKRLPDFYLKFLD